MLDEAWEGTGEEKSLMGLLDESKGSYFFFRIMLSV